MSLSELSWENITTAIVGILTLIGAGVLKLGPFTIKLQRKDHSDDMTYVPDECPSPECHEELVNTVQSVRDITGEVTYIKDKIDKLDYSVRDIYPKINHTASAVARIEGYMEGIRNGNHG